MKRRVGLTGILILFMGLMACLVPVRRALGQAVSGSVFGTVTDPAGAVVPGVTVTIRDLDRGIDYHVQTISDGNYIQTHLLAGHYRITIAPPGFQTFAAEANVEVDASTRVDAQLAVGKATTTVNVTGRNSLAQNRPGGTE